MALNPTLLCGNGKGVEVTPITNGLAEKLLSRKGNYTTIFCNNSNASIEEQVKQMKEVFQWIDIARTTPSFLASRFDEMECAEMLYIDYDSDQMFLITPL